MPQKASNAQQHPLDSQHADTIRSLQKSFSAASSEHFPSSTVGIYPANSDSAIVILLVASKYSPQNYWNGRWRSTYTLDPSSNSVTGTIKVDVHYYEDGNVRMSTNKKVEVSGTSADSVVREIAKAENKFQEELNRGFTSLAEGSFKGLRRQLPVTRQKVSVFCRLHTLYRTLTCGRSSGRRYRATAWAKMSQEEGRGRRSARRPVLTAVYLECAYSPLIVSNRAMCLVQTRLAAVLPHFSLPPSTRLRSCPVSFAPSSPTGPEPRCVIGRSRGEHARATAPLLKFLALRNLTLFHNTNSRGGPTVLGNTHQPPTTFISQSLIREREMGLLRPRQFLAVSTIGALVRTSLRMTTEMHAYTSTVLGHRLWW